MLGNLVSIALQRRFLVLGIFGVISILGIKSAKEMAIDAVPDITNVQVVVNTKTGGLDPSKVERLVSYPIETELSGLQNVVEVRSLSKYGLSQITIVFEEHTNLYFARQLVNEKLQSVRAGLPNGLSPELAPVTTGLGEVLMYVLEVRPESVWTKKSEKEQLMYLREVQEYVIRPKLKMVKGIADVDTGGGYSKQVHINIYPNKMAEYGISLERLVQRVESIGETFGGGYIQQNGSQLIVRSSGQITDLKSISQIPLGLKFNGQPIYVGDVATVSMDHALRLGAATHDGKETVLGTVLMRSGANSREVAQGAEQALTQEIKLPEDVTLKLVYSRGRLVDATVRTILWNLFEGAALVVLILILLLGNWRASLIVAAAIPVSMFFALTGMKFFGISANLMSLGAIDFGLLVDASVVLVENVLRRVSHERAENSKWNRLKLILSASHEVVRPLTFGLLIIMVVYIPILFLEGIEGKMFRPMAETVLLALFGSLMVGLFLMPVLCYFVLGKVRESEHDTFLFQKINTLFRPVLGFVLRHLWALGALTVVPAIIAAYLFSTLGSDFIPSLDEGDLVINLARATNQDIDTSVEHQKRAEKMISGFGEVETVFSRMGTPESALDPMSPSLADTFIILKRDQSQWPKVNGRVRTKSELYSELESRLMELNSDQEVAANQPIEMRFNEMLEGSRADVSLRIFGPDLDQLMMYSDQAKKVLESVSGIESIESDPLTALTKSPVLDIRLDYGKLAAYQLEIGKVNSLLEKAMGGHEIGSYYEVDRRFPILVHLAEGLRNEIDEIAKIPVELPQGGTIPLRAVTKIEETDQVTTVARSGSRRYSALAINLKDRDIESFVQEAKTEIESKISLGPGYEWSWGGQFKNLESARRRLMVVVPITLIAIFALLINAFGNARHAVLVFSAIPFAMVGGAFSLWLRDINFSVSAAVGFIALAGIATLNSMVLVTFFNQLREAGKSILEVVHDGTIARLKPVLSTALVAALGFLPMALSRGAGAEVQRPLATVVIGGLITSTILTLLVIPKLYLILEHRIQDRQKNEPTGTSL